MIKYVWDEPSLSLHYSSCRFPHVSSSLSSFPSAFFPSSLSLSLSLCLSFLFIRPSFSELSYITFVEEGEGVLLNHQTPPHMKAPPSSGLHYWHTDIWDIFFRFSNNRLFDLWAGIRISLQKSYRWKDNREWDICPVRERERKWIYPHVLLVIPSLQPCWDLFCSDSSRSHRELDFCHLKNPFSVILHFTLCV